MKIINPQFNETEFQDNQKTNQKISLKKITKITIAVVVFVILSFFMIVAVRAFSFKKNTSASALTQNQILQLESFLMENYPQNYQILKNLPYNIS